VARGARVTVTRTTSVLYGSFALPLATIGLPLTIYLAPFYAGEIGLSLALLGTAMFVARLADIVVDPLIGTLSDRWRPALGRRKVWLLIGPVLLLGGMTMLFNPPPGIGMGYFLGWLTVMYLGFSATRLPYFAWGGELADDYHARTRIAGTRQTFSVAGLVLSTLVPTIVLARPGATGGDVLAALSVMMLIVMPLLAALVFFRVPEPAPAATERRVDWRAGLRAMRRNPPLRRLLLILFLGFVAETFRQTITVFFARDVIGVPNLGLVYFLYFLAALAAVPFWRWYGQRVGKHRALATGFSMVIATNLAIFLLGPGDVVLFTAMFIGKGLCFAALELMPAAMTADIADVDTAMSRERRMGLFMAAIGVVANLGQAFGQGLSLNLLAAAGYQAAGGNGPDAILWLRILYAVAPTALLVAALWLSLGYPLDARRHERIRQRLATRDARAARTASG
jgi:glycoside/pentoside/hexuronide:cation symporter, GPH family